MRRGGVRAFLVQALQPEFRGHYMVPENPKMPILHAAEGGTNEIYQLTIDEKRELQCSSLRAVLEGYPRLSCAPSTLRGDSGQASSQRPQQTGEAIGAETGAAPAFNRV